MTSKKVVNTLYTDCHSNHGIIGEGVILRGKQLIRKEMLLERLLKEGTDYLLTMEELHACLRRHSYEYRKMLFVIDRYSRYKTQLKENLEELVLYNSNMLDDEDVEGEYMDIEMERYEDAEDFVFYEEYFNNFDNIAYQRNILANMEMSILHMLVVDGSLANIEFSVHSKLKVLLKDYYQRVEKFLERNKMLVEFQGNFEMKYNQLQQLIIKITEKELFLMEIIQPRVVKDNGENKNN